MKGNKKSLDNQILDLRLKLNAMMKKTNGEVNKEIIFISQQLDKLIDEYYHTCMGKN